jgi:aspartate aminotransferase
MLTYRALVSPGDKVVLVGPVWPNIKKCGAHSWGQCGTFNLHRGPDSLHWKLGTEGLIEALGTDSKIFILNSPNNPTGRMASAE